MRVIDPRKYVDINTVVGGLGGAFTPTAPVIPDLKALRLVPSTFKLGDAPGTFIGNILDTTAGSSLDLVDSHGGAVKFNLAETGLLVGDTPTVLSGAFDIVLDEYFGDYVRRTTLQVQVLPVGGALVFNLPVNSAWLGAF